MKPRAARQQPPQPERAPRSLVRAQLGHEDCANGDWLTHFEKLFGEWAAFAKKYSGNDRDAAQAEVEANRGRCECEVLKGILQAERSREQLLTAEWVGFTRDITQNEMIAAREWAAWDPTRRANFLNHINDLKDKRAAAENAWRQTSEQIGFFNRQLKTGCEDGVKNLLSQRWDRRNERLRSSAKLLSHGGVGLRQRAATRYHQTGGLLLKAINAQNAVGKLVGSYTGKPVQAFSTSLRHYLGAAPT